MEEIKQEGNMEVIESTENQEVNQNQESQESVNNTPNLEENNLMNWQKDSRYGKMWKTADDLYKSYGELEKRYPDIKGKFDKISKSLEKYGLNPDNFDDEMEKIKDYRNPDSQMNKVYNYIKSFLDNEYTREKVLKFYDDLELSELERLYPNMSAEQRQRQIELEKEIKTLKEAEQKRKDEQDRNETLNVINSSIENCSKIAKEYGFNLTQDVQVFLLEHCAKNNIAPRYIEAEFYKLYGKQLMEARDKKVIENTKTNEKKLQEAKILGGGNGSTTTAPKLKGKEGFLAGLSKILGQ